MTKSVQDVIQEAKPYEPAESEPETAERAKFKLTDTGNSERLVARHGKDLHYCAALGGWLVWAGPRWLRDDLGEIDRLGKETIRSIYKQAAEVGDDALCKELVDHARRSENASRRHAMIALAQSEDGIPVRPEIWDSNPWLLNCENGTLDLRSGKLRSHQRRDMITRFAPVNYSPGAKAPTWEAVLERCLPDDDLRAYFQRSVGYGCTGDVSEQCLFFMYGAGLNGKSTILAAIMAALGDYAIQAAPDLLIAKEMSGPNNDVAELKGARFVATVEIEDGKKLAEGLVKQITGGDLVKARFMRQDYFAFAPTHKIFLAANHKPTIYGGDHAIWRRIKMVPFDVRIPDDERDKRLPEKLRAELPGILAWIVRGCLEWQKNGLGEPEAVRAATERYRAEMDAIGPFLEDRCVLCPTARITVRELHDAYTSWCETNKEKPLGKSIFGRRLQEHGDIGPLAGVGPTKSRGWHGIGLRVTENGDKVTNSDIDSSINNNNLSHESLIGKITSPNVTLSPDESQRETLIL